MDEELWQQSPLIKTFHLIYINAFIWNVTGCTRLLLRALEMKVYSLLLSVYKGYNQGECNEYSNETEVNYCCLYLWSILNSLCLIDSKWWSWSAIFSCPVEERFRTLGGVNLAVCPSGILITLQDTCVLLKNRTERQNLEPFTWEFYMRELSLVFYFL